MMGEEIKTDTSTLEKNKDFSSIVLKLRDAGKAWKNQGFEARKRCFRLMRNILSNDPDKFIHFLELDNKKSKLEALSQEIIPVLDTLEFLEKNTEKYLSAQKVQLNTKQFYFRGKENYYFYEPYGVIGILGTWNYPFILSMTQILFALAAGNAVIFKGSPGTERITSGISDLLIQSGFPKNIFYGFVGGRSDGELLCAAGCDKYILTGSKKTGQSVLSQLSHHVKPVVLELSGCDPYIILGDADWKLAIKTLLWASFQYSGQTCVAPRRIFILSKDKEKFFKIMKAEWKAQEAFLSDQGQLFSPNQIQSEKNKLQQLIDQGAKVELGDMDSGDANKDFGPKILSGISDAVLNQYDFMSPVSFIIDKESEEEILNAVNNHDLALGATLWTADSQKARAWARDIRAGQVWINDSLFSVALGEVSFGGFKSTGFGKTRGVDGLLEMVEKKFVSFDWRSKRMNKHLPPYENNSYDVLKTLQKILYLPSKKDKWKAMLDLVKIFGPKK